MSAGKVNADALRAVLFVEMNGQAYRVHLPPERMQLVVALAGSLGDDGALPIKKTDEYAFAPAAGIDPRDAEITRLRGLLRDLWEGQEPDDWLDSFVSEVNSALVGGGEKAA